MDRPSLSLPPTPPDTDGGAPVVPPREPEIDMGGDSPWLHLAVGLAQGTSVYLPWANWCEACAADSTTTGRVALLYAALVAPMVWHFTSGGVRSGVVRAIASIGVGLLFGAMAGWTFERSNPTHGWWGSDLALVSFNLPLIVLTAVTVSLLVSFDRSRGAAGRAQPIDFAGRNALLLVAAAMLTAMLWILLGASGWLMLAIGVDAWMRTLTAFGFIAPLTGGVFGLAIGAMLQRPRALDAVRAMVLQSTGWLLPPAVALLAVWAAALPFTGFAALHRTRNAALYLLWFGALCIVFANAWQRGRADRHIAAAKLGDGWIPFAIRHAWPLANLLPAVAGWALYVRVEQYGLTPERVWAVAVCIVVAVCTCGYSLHAWTERRWLSNLAAINTIAAVVLVAMLSMLVTPLADVRKLSVLNQVARLRSGAVTADAFDWQFLRYRSDHYGREALGRLAALPRTMPWSDAVAARAMRELDEIGKTDSADRPEGPRPTPVPVPSGRP